MNDITTPLIIRPANKKMTSWKLVEPFVFRLDRNEYVVPAGFETDFASVPRLFWNILPPWGRYGKAAVLHDYLYRTAAVSRREADEIFLKAMEKLGVHAWKRYIMYAAVRLFGGKAYAKQET